MKYYLLDDDIHFHNLFKKILIRKGIEIDIMYFTSPFLFLEEIEKNPNGKEIVFLDIDMPNGNGIEISKKIQMKYRNKIIVFLTNRTDLMADAFGINVFGFMPKKEIEDKINDLLVNINQAINPDKSLSFKISAGLINIAPNDILLIERTNRKIWIIQQNAEQCCLNYKTLESVYEQLDHQMFIYANRGQIINFMHVKHITSNKIVLYSGLTIFASVFKKKEIENKYNQYLLKSAK